MTFANKGMEHINISAIMNLPEIVQSLPELLRDEMKQPKIVMKLDKPIRNKIMNYESTVRSIHHTNDEDGSFTLCSETNTPFPCSCSDSTFCDPNHGHIVTGDLRIVENSKLRKLLSKGPNYRENKTINYSKCNKEINQGLDLCASNLASKYKIPLASFENWLSSIKRKVADKVRQLKSTKVPQQTKPVLRDEIIRNTYSYLSIKLLTTLPLSVNNSM